MKKFLLLIFVSGTVIITAHAQAPAKAVFFEIGGPGVASLNYDMRFTKSESGIGGRIGFGGFSLGTGSDRTTALFIPIGLTYLLGKDERNYFEVGGGVTPVIVSDTYNGTSENLRSTFGHLNIGYRMQPKAGGFFFRAAINPVFGKGFFWPYYGGIAFGYKF
ncbi:hypothetical protein [Ferruginibacter sp.]|nr:hypothetical protein [Ferruginibacter sp.]